ncbi:flagellin [Burkholderia ubonensis]|uniref:flagellin N-terminal helical domain-containing protein n=1 Tax=Burkholderia ubonensis TaxID=101571 RepID=UPI0007544B4F|nr:flagellin [Burkholderia ubonensis]KWB79432.1 hypothetical protein WL42_12515 [Burkholderia ubonensis]
MLSLHTNLAALMIENAMNRASAAQKQSEIRLGTGYRINSAADDAAGLQISARLDAQTSGMGVASQNTQDGISLLQTADGAFEEMTKIVNRMKDLATQAANDSNATVDKKALQAEYDALGHELYNEMQNTSYGGAQLFGAGASGATLSGMFAGASGITFQIGATSAETMTVDLHSELAAINNAFAANASGYSATGSASGSEITTTSGANAMIDKLNGILDNIGSMRAGLGAAENRLTHTNNNLSNMSSNTTDATGRIKDTDYASEVTKNQQATTLVQSGQMMLKQANQMSQSILALLQG